MERTLQRCDSVGCSTELVLQSAAELVDRTLGIALRTRFNASLSQLSHEPVGDLLEPAVVFCLALKLLTKFINFSLQLQPMQ
eukprot:CAMPEP_0119331838 /NCGR_PEP_ID=MMETSP1333-20130426/81492_1 /TAXON_ID=418940 /ORGANISM="Scyphosphaera apsteinii, Strain RCC1455" /LENGTH=81 /DNA_ID=CAMNT_0007341527 /DNA_START=479 /DNA_END=724 /DNA_ORIENTATION=+